MMTEPSYHFDAHTQREVIHDLDAAREWLQYLRDLGMSGEPRLVIWLRLLGHLSEAEDLGWKVLERSGGPATPGEVDDAALPLTAVVAAIRLAHVLQWQARFDLAHALFERAIEAIEQVEPLSEDSAYADYLRPYAHQHQARCYFEQGKYREALASSQEAHELRVTAGVPEDLVLASVALMRAARSRMS